MEISSKTLSRMATALLYLSFAVAVLVSVLMLTGMVAYFAKTFYHVQPRWMFGLFD